MVLPPTYFWFLVLFGFVAFCLVAFCLLLFCLCFGGKLFVGLSGRGFWGVPKFFLLLVVVLWGLFWFCEGVCDG